MREEGSTALASAFESSPEDETDDEPRVLPLVFKGNARDYFRLWIVNLCLTLFTFGIFSAWAKVRRKRYFYSHTELAGTPFQYLAEPIPILKGRIIAVVMLVLWYAGTHFSLRLLGIVFCAGVVLLPWVMIRTAAFNARYTAYRNMTLRFSGTYFGLAGTLLLALLLVLATFGLGYPWSFTRVRRYFVEHTSFGGVRARYAALGGHLLRPFLVLLVSSLVAAALVISLISAFGGLTRRLEPGIGGFYAGYAIASAYMAARVAAVNWRHTSLGPLVFRADYRARDFIWLYLTNAVAILASLGLLIPWAAVRVHRYRVERLRVLQTGHLDVFEGRAEPAVRAAGAEVADLFDFDLSL